MDKIAWWTTQDAAFVMGKDKFYIAKQMKKGYKYAGLESVDDYIASFVDTVRRNVRRKKKVELVFNEVIAKWKPRRIYFDIEYIKNNKYIFDPSSFIEKLIDGISDELKSLGHELKIESVFILDSSRLKDDGSYKYSYHVVITDFYLQDAGQSSVFADKVKARMAKTAINREFLTAIDDNVYTSNRLMRMAGCTKLGQNAPLNIYDFTYKGETRTYDCNFDNELETWEYLLTNTIIQNTSGIEIYYPIAKIQTYEYDTELTQDTYNAVVSIMEQAMDITELETREGEVAFSLGKITPSSIIFDREAPSFCSICKRVHDSVGYILFINLNGNISRMCFANKKNIVQIGNHKDKNVKKNPNIFVHRLQNVVDMKRMGITGNDMIAYLLETSGIIVYGDKRIKL